MVANWGQSGNRLEIPGLPPDFERKLPYLKHFGKIYNLATTTFFE
jgi:hypothetical protein